MNQSERDALREKHRDNGIDGRCETCHYDTPIEGLTDISVCTAPPYPCDVIKVLDAWETERNDIKTALGSIHVVDRVQNAADILWKV
jgi:hypothetical protein